MKKFFFITISFLLSASMINAQKKEKNMALLIDEQMKFAKEQYKVLAKNVPYDQMPKTFQNNKVETSNMEWWCSGFFPGALLYIYEYNKDIETRLEAEKRLAALEPMKHYAGNHDVGFRMFCSFGNAYRLFKKPEYKAVIETSAASLATRYIPSIKSIKSWDNNKNFKCPVIIDNMMNLELLCWVTDNGGDAIFKEIANNHAGTTLATHYRPDYSSYHVVDYDADHTKLERKVTVQGFSDQSAWARGQMWGLYGFVAMYRSTRDNKYLEQARQIANFVMSHPNKPKDLIPYWDYDAPDIPGALRDASAAAIEASALLELSQYVSKSLRKKYVKEAEQIIRSLSSAQYRARLGENGGFLLKHSVGYLLAKSEVDVPLTYADYYFLEALQRYKKWYHK